MLTGRKGQAGRSETRSKHSDDYPKGGFRKAIKRWGVYFLTLLLLPVWLFSPSFVSAQESSAELKGLQEPQVTISLSSRHTKNTLWQREQLLVTLEVKTDDPFSRLDVDDFKQAGFSIISYPLERLEGKHITRLVQKWAVYPFIAGEQQLQLPRIRYRPNRGRIKTLESKTLHFKVRPLPIYVPPTMPVGKIHINSDWQGGRLIRTNRLQSWRLRLSGGGVMSQTMPPISQQLDSNQSVMVLPIQQQRLAVKQDHGITQEVTYTIPFKVIKNGRVSFPPVAIQYFDPTTGKLEKSKLAMPMVVSLNGWLYALLFTIPLLLVIILTKIIYQQIRRMILRSKEKKRLLSLFETAENYQQIRDAIRQLSSFLGWDNNISLEQFAMRWAESYGESAKLNKIIKKLQILAFSAELTGQKEQKMIQILSHDLMKLV